MQANSRFEIIESIAQGDFATVYRARDLELGREVAVKQIHQQYLTDPKKLDRYWHEAQLLARLEHPYIMTIYDIVRGRGWLILELMQGSLKEKLAGKPIDLEDLRLTLTYMLHALSFLEKNGIVHGDVKPSNLLLDKNHRVKLGDFGIARRMTSDDGSVVKGTTKYMAPEVVSDQFGPVGPHSDLYALGFSAFELMCGEYFDSLFPGLNMFGRDQQIAWMMWHSAPDRRLPEISRVLQGVPADLAHVIAKLTEKDPARRYRTAEEALKDLRSKTPVATGADGEESDKTKPDGQPDRRRYLVFGALALSLLLSLAMVFLPSSGNSDKPGIGPGDRPESGLVVDVNLEQNVIGIKVPNGKDGGILFNPDIDTIQLHIGQRRELIDLNALRPGDQLRMQYTKTDRGVMQTIIVTRAETESLSGTIDSIDQGNGVIVVLPVGGQPTQVHMAAAARYLLNGDEAKLGELKKEDRVEIEFIDQGGKRSGQYVTAKRLVSAQGVIVQLDPTKSRFTFRPGGEPEGAEKPLTLDPQCAISLNGVARFSDGRVVALGDLAAGDRVEIQHDTHALRIDAQRESTVSGLVRGVDPEARRLVVQLYNPRTMADFALADGCKIELDGTSQPCDFSFIRPPDDVTIVYDSAELAGAKAKSITVKPAPDDRSWAIIIGQGKYDDRGLAQLKTALSDAALLRSTLTNWYRVPEEQMLLATDATRLKLEQDLAPFLKKVAPGSQLLVYFGGHGFLDKQGAPQLATKEFDSSRMEQSGWTLASLIALLEGCAAGEKILLLDTAGGEPGRGLVPPATSELVAALQVTPGKAISSSVTIVAGCEKGERPLTDKNGQQGWFAMQAAAALTGKADRNGDFRVDRDELFVYLRNTMTSFVDAGGATQTPVLFLPGAKSQRLLPETKEAVVKLLRYLDLTRLPDEHVAEFDAAFKLQPEEPDVKLVYALVMLKQGKTADSQKEFESLAADHPGSLLPHHALAIQNFNKKLYDRGLNDLEKLVTHLPKPQAEAYDAYSAHALNLAGGMYEYARQLADPAASATDLTRLTQAVSAHGKKAEEQFTKGVQRVAAAIADFDRQIKLATDPKERDRLERLRRTLGQYIRPDYELAGDYIRDRLEK